MCGGGGQRIAIAGYSRRTLVLAQVRGRRCWCRRARPKYSANMLERSVIIMPMYVPRQAPYLRAQPVSPHTFSVALPPQFLPRKRQGARETAARAR